MTESPLLTETTNAVTASEEAQTAISGRELGRVAGGAGQRTGHEEELGDIAQERSGRHPCACIGAAWA
jgi:hypothetical protein